MDAIVGENQVQSKEDDARRIDQFHCTLPEEAEGGIKWRIGGRKANNVPRWLRTASEITGLNDVSLGSRRGANT